MDRRPAQPQHFHSLPSHNLDGFHILQLLCAYGPTPGYYTRSYDGNVVPVTGRDLESVEAEHGPAPQREIPSAIFSNNPLQVKEKTPPRARHASMQGTLAGGF